MKQSFLDILSQEVLRIDNAHTSKRNEKIIERFEGNKGIINGKPTHIFNSNDYLGLRHHPRLKKAEYTASEIYGTGPGAVRFISGTLSLYKDLEKRVASFHKKDDAMVFSSAFATNLAVLFCLIQGQSKDSLLEPNVLVVSDALNHRSIIDGIRLANLPKEQKTIFEHLNPANLKQILEDNKSTFKRALIVTDGVFSMLGEYQRLKELRTIVNEYDQIYEQGVLLVVDDAHGVGAVGETGRGTEEIEHTYADVLIGTFGKAFGADGGYVASNQAIITYLRESAATYIYSNSVSPGTAGAALEALILIDEDEGKKLISTSQENTEYFKKSLVSAGLKFAADSNHPIQPVLIGDPEKTQKTVAYLLENNILVTQISYPVVAKGKDEIRVQISASHTKEDIDYLVEHLKKAQSIINF